MIIRLTVWIILATIALSLIGVASAKAQNNDMDTSISNKVTLSGVERPGNLLTPVEKWLLAGQWLPTIWAHNGEDCGPRWEDAFWCVDGEINRPHQYGLIWHDVTELGFNGLVAINYTLFLDRDCNAWTGGHDFDHEGFVILLQECPDCPMGYRMLSAQTCGHHTTRYESWDRLYPHEFDQTAPIDLLIGDDTHAFYVHESVCDRQIYGIEECEYHIVINDSCVRTEIEHTPCSCGDDPSLTCLNIHIHNPDCWAQRLQYTGIYCNSFGVSNTNYDWLVQQVKHFPPWLPMDVSLPDGLAYVDLYESENFLADDGHTGPDERANFGDLLVDMQMPLRLVCYNYDPWWHEYYDPIHAFDVHKLGLDREANRYIYYTRKDDISFWDDISSFRLHGLPGTILILYDGSSWFGYTIPDGQRIFDDADLGPLSNKADFITWGFGPTADAGQDMIIPCWEDVILDASGSFEWALDKSTLRSTFGIAPDTFSYEGDWGYSWVDESDNGRLLGNGWHLTTRLPIGNRRIRLNVSGEAYPLPHDLSFHYRRTVSDWIDVLVMPPVEADISIDYPQAGEQLCAGDIYRISWGPHCQGLTVSIEYTLDGGYNWSPVADDIGRPTQCWRVPDTNASSCQVRVTSTEGYFTVYSEGAFSIRAPRFSSEPAMNSVSMLSPGRIKLSCDLGIDGLSATDSSIIVQTAFSGRCTGSWQNSGSDTVIFNPDYGLLPGDQVLVTVTNDLLAIDGSDLCGPYVWTFTQGPAEGASPDFDYWRSYATFGRPVLLCAADLDQDGKVDLAVVARNDVLETDKLVILLNQGQGMFLRVSEYVIGEDANTILAGDYNWDGMIDLAILRKEEEQLSLFLNAGGGFLTLDTCCDLGCVSGKRPWSLGQGDIDGDGRIDLVVGSEKNYVGIYMNDGTPAFSYELYFDARVGEDIIVHLADIDGDYTSDIIYAGTRRPRIGVAKRVFVVSGELVSEQYVVDDRGLHGDILCLASGDVDSDGDIDIVVGGEKRTSGLVHIMTNLPSGLFDSLVTIELGESISSLILADIDGDADLDILAADIIADSLWILRNHEGSFDTWLAWGDLDSPSSQVVADFDGDKVLDIAIALTEIDSVAILYGNFDSTSTCVEQEPGNLIPKAYFLDQNYPNPFNPTTVIKFDLPRRSHVSIMIFNLVGQKVAELVDRDYPAGSHHITWDGLSSSGQRVSSGVYFYRIVAEDFIDTKKMILLK